MASKTKVEKNGVGGSWSDDPARAEKNAQHLAALEAAVAAQNDDGGPAGTIHLPKLDIGVITLRIVGDSPLIVHRFSEKARKMMLDKQTGRASAGRAKKVPEEDYQSSLYRTPDGKFGFPAVAFKNCAVSACTSLGRQVITKVAARQSFHVVGELVEIVGEPRMREDIVRLQSGVCDIRHRGEFPEWSTELTVRFNRRVISTEQLANLLSTAGFAVGVGEWRPEKGGSYGCFHVE